MTEPDGNEHTGPDSEQEPRSLADKLNHLFETVRNPETGRPYSNAEASQAIEGASGPDGPRISPSGLAQLRRGAKPNPTVRTIEALARLFGVAPAYFFLDFDEESAERVRAGLELISSVRDNDVHGLAFRANGLSADSLRMIKGVIEQARRLEGLEEQEK